MDEVVGAMDYRWTPGGSMSPNRYVQPRRGGLSILGNITSVIESAASVFFLLKIILKSSAYERFISEHKSFRVVRQTL